jgi:hypothetical protein
MGSFKEFAEHTQQVELILNEFNSAPSLQSQPQEKMKMWSAKKPEIMQMWQNLRADTPIVIAPMSDNGTQADHSSYGEDGIRITGSWYFITSMLSRLKEILVHENPQSKLRLILRAVDPSRASNPQKQSYVFYCNLEKRSHGKPGRPKKNQTPLA